MTQGFDSETFPLSSMNLLLFIKVYLQENAASLLFSPWVWPTVTLSDLNSDLNSRSRATPGKLCG
jgi:hypothetical protein